MGESNAWLDGLHDGSKGELKIRLKRDNFSSIYARPSYRKMLNSIARDLKTSTYRTYSSEQLYNN